MITIFNKKLNAEILIDESVDWIQFIPKHYEDKPHVIIEMHEFHFPAHAEKCNDCKKFMEAYGKESFDWYISYDNNIYRLDTKQVGQRGYAENKVTVTMSDYNPGTKLILAFSDIPTDKEELKSLLNTIVENEDYQKACFLRDLIKEN